MRYVLVLSRGRVESYLGWSLKVGRQLGLDVDLMPQAVVVNVRVG